MSILIFLLQKKIKYDRFVDGLASRGSAAVVKRLKGEDVDKFETNGTLAQILSKGALKLKVVVISGEQDAKKTGKLGNSVHGLGWDPVHDTIEVDARVNDTNLRLK